MVLVADEYSLIPKTKRISEILTKDYVWSCNTNSAYCVRQQVSAINSHQVDSIVRVTINGITVDSTPDHLFYRWNEIEQIGSWIPAICLKSGEELDSISGQQIFVDTVELKRQSTTVYNFSVNSESGSHNYYITDLGILVHNCGNEPGADLPYDQLGTGSIMAGAEALEFAAELGVEVVDILTIITPAKVPASIVKMGKNAVKRYLKGMLKDKIKEGGNVNSVGRGNGPVFKTTKEATTKAKELGFDKISERVNGQPVYRPGKEYITRDVDGHNGGAWKKVKSVQDLAKKETRSGTYDANLNRIGD